MKTPIWAQKYKDQMQMLSMPQGPMQGAMQGYTGAGMDGRVQPSKPVFQDILEVHEGEYIVKKDDVDKLGGPKGLEKKLGLKGSKPPEIVPMACGGTVKKMDKGGYLKPIVAKYATGGMVGPRYQQDASGNWVVVGGTQQAAGSNVAASPRYQQDASGAWTPVGGVRQGAASNNPYQAAGFTSNGRGGYTGGYENPYADKGFKQISTGGKTMTFNSQQEEEDFKKKGIMPVPKWQQQINKIKDMGGNAYNKRAMMNPIGGQIMKYASGGYILNANNEWVPKATGFLANPINEAARSSTVGGVASGEGNFGDEFANGGKVINGVTYNSQAELDRARADLRLANSPTTGPGPSPVAAPSPFVSEVGRTDADPNAGQYGSAEVGVPTIPAPIATPKPTVYAPAGSNVASAPAPIGTTATTADQANVGRYTAQIDDWQTEYQKIARGESPMVKKLADLAYGQLDPRLATATTVTAMQVAANPYMTDGAKRAAIAGQLIANGVAQSGLAQELATQSLNMAMDAMAKGTSLSQTQQSFFDDVKRYNKSEGWKEVDMALKYGSDEDVARAYGATTGKTLDANAIAEIRGYDRELRRQNIVAGQFKLDDARRALGDADFNSLSGMIGSGATFAQVQARFPNVTQDQYDSIQDASPLGDRTYTRNMSLVQTLLATGGKENLARASQLMGQYFGGTIDFTPLMTKENGSNFTSGMGIITTGISANSTWDIVKDELKASNLIDALGGEDKAKTIFETLKTNNNPINRYMATVDDNSIVTAFNLDTASSTPENIGKIREAIKGYLSFNQVRNDKGDIVPPNMENLTAHLRSVGVIPKGEEGDNNTPEFGKMTSEQIGTWLTTAGLSAGMVDNLKTTMNPKDIAKEFIGTENYNSILEAARAFQVSLVRNVLNDQDVRYRRVSSPIGITGYSVQWMTDGSYKVFKGTQEVFKSDKAEDVVSYMADIIKTK